MFDSDWKTLLLKLFQDRINLMTKEFYQYHVNHDFKTELEGDELLNDILKEISEGKIESCHINQKEANNYLKLVKHCAEGKN